MFLISEAAFLAPMAFRTPPGWLNSHALSLHEILGSHVVDLLHYDLVAVLLGRGDDPRFPDALFLLRKFHPIRDPRPKSDFWTTKLSTVSSFLGR